MRRVGSCVLVSLVLLVLAGLAASCGEESSQVADERSVEAVNPPTTAASPKPEEDEDTERTEATTAEIEETTGAANVGATAGQYAYQYKEVDAFQYEPPASESPSQQPVASEAAPEDPTMYLSIPKLGIAGAVVLDGEAGLEAGAMHLSGTGYPWLPGSNTYIAGHRVGFPGTGSDHIFYSLPSMTQGDEITLEDSNGQTYTYRVSEVFAVEPSELWVTAPTGSDMVTLQVCTETPDDWWTIGPRLMESGPDSGRLIVRATRVA